MFRHVLPALLCLTFPTAGAAEEPIEEAEGPAMYRLETVVIEATRPITTAGGASAVEVETDSLAIPPAATTEDVLRALPFLHVRTNSRGEAEISARGSESRQVAILVDGVPITLSWDARADVSVIPATAIREITFVRGLSSVLYGPNVLGGIVEARVGQVREQPTAPSTRIEMGADHVGTFGTTITGTVPFAAAGGEWIARGGVGFRDTPGDPLATDVLERPGHGDGLRLNTDARDVDGFAALRYRAEGGAWWSFSGSSFRAERGIAAELGAPDEDARFWRYPHVSRTLAVASGGTGDRESPFGGRGDLETSLGLDRGRTEIDSYTSAAYDEIDSFENGEDRTLTVRLLGDQTMGGRADLRSAFTLAEVRHDETTPDGEARYRQRLWSGGLESNWRLVESTGPVSSLRLSVGSVYDVAETRESGGREGLDRISEWGGRVGLSMLTRNGRTRWHAGVSQRGRFPALRELYSGALNRFVPNPDLDPEKLLAVEGGATTTFGAGELQSVLFYHRVTDAVVRITLPDRRFMRVNRNELESTGLELLGYWRAGRLAFSGDFTAQSVQLTDTASRETHEPENLPELFGSVDARFHGARGLFGGVECAFTGRQFAIDVATGEDAELEAAAIVGGYVGRIWDRPFGAGGPFRSFETRVAADNVTDRVHYDQFGLPEPGRRFRFEVRLY